MNKAHLFFLIFFLSLSVRYVDAQVLGISLGMEGLMDVEDLTYKGFSNKTFQLSIDKLPSKFIGTGFDFNYASVEEDLSFWNLRWKLGTIIMNGSRIQVPISMFVGMDILSGDSIDTEYGNYSWGFKSGVRFYLTNRLAVQGFLYQTNPFDITFESSEILSTNGKRLSLGICYAYEIDEP